jgi:hypothetical protein
MTELRDLAKQALRLRDLLYNQAMDAAIAGDRNRADRLERISQRALARYGRRFDAYCRQQSRPT